MSSVPLSSLDAVILGVVQALTEFLPVSSSGHLVLAQHLLGIDTGGGALFEIAVHVGTLMSVLIMLRAPIISLIIGGLRPHKAGNEWWSEMKFLIIGTIPAGLFGVMFKDHLEHLFGNLAAVGFSLCLTGIILLSTLRLTPTRIDLKPIDGFWIGLSQALAILPGVSRSGSTISAALWLGIERTRAAQLSFLLSVPVVGGAAILKLKDLYHAPINPQLITPLCIGAFTSFIVGLGALWVMLKWLTRPSFGYFGHYCLIAGILALFFAI